jgi:hypothetical protein
MKARQNQYGETISSHPALAQPLGTIYDQQKQHTSITIQTDN